MPSTKTITDSDLGEVKLTKYKGARYLRIRIEKPQFIKVSLPFYVSYQEAISFVKDKQNWILEEYQKIESQKAQMKLINPQGYVGLPESTPDGITQTLKT